MTRLTHRALDVVHDALMAVVIGAATVLRVVRGRA